MEGHSIKFLAGTTENCQGHEKLWEGEEAGRAQSRVGMHDDHLQCGILDRKGMFNGKNGWN